MNLRVCICEDEEINQILLNDIIKYYCKSKHLEFDIIKYFSGNALLDDFKESLVYPDILFMDIDLQDTNGFTVCQTLRKANYKGIIIFITESPEYAVQGYKVDARGYLLKPFDVQEICQTFDRILGNNGKIAYTIKVYNQIIRIPLHEIYYIESQNTRCIIHCNGNITYTIYKKLSEVEEEIDSTQFLRCHRSYLVNMDAIKMADATSFILHSGDTVPIKAKESKPIKDKYIQYVKKS